MRAPRKQLSDVLLIAVFVLVVGVGLVGTFGRDYLPEFTESRALARAPTLQDFARPEKLPGVVTSYFADHFGLRKILLFQYFRFKINVLHADLSLDVVEGKDGWLFFKEEVPDFRFEHPLNAAEVENIRGRVDQWCEYARAHRAALALLIAPNKSTIYPEKVPEYLTSFGRAAPIDQILGAECSCPVIKIDPRADLRAARDPLLYFNWGTHWNDRAALMDWQQLRAAVPGVSWLTRTLVMQERPAGYNEDSMWAWYGAKDPEQISLPHVTFPDPPNDQGANPVRLLAVGDSFLEFMIGLAPGFAGPFAITAPENVPTVDQDIVGNLAWFVTRGADIPLETAIEKFTPNVILLEVVERNTRQLGTLSPPPGAPPVKN